MVKVILLLVYLMKGELVVEQKPFLTEAECMAAGEKRVASIITNPDLDELILAGCTPARVKEASLPRRMVG